MKTRPIPTVLLALMMPFLHDARAASLSTEQPSPEEMSRELGIELPRLPWHLVDIWWQFDAPITAFESLSMEVTIDRDIPDTYNLYIAPVGVGQLNGLQFYGGLQSNINGWASKDSRTRVHPGRGAIFSRWSHDKEQPIGLGHVRIASDGLCESAGYEGEFCSVRRPYAWTQGTYTYSIVKGDVETIGDQAHTWFHCLVRSHQDGRTTYIGSLRFEGQAFTFWPRHAAFVEIYATSKIPRSGIPKVGVTFGYPRINGTPPPLKQATAHYNPGQSPACATAYAEGEAIRVEVGPLFVREKDRGQHALDLDLSAISTED